jgi:hypothetical protein
MDGQSDRKMRLWTEGRLNSRREDETRKRIGVCVAAVTVLAAIVSPDLRRQYGHLTTALGSALATYRTGLQSV